MAIEGIKKFTNIAKLNMERAAPFHDKHLGVSIAELELQGVTRGELAGRNPAAAAGEVIQDEGGAINIETVAGLIEIISTDAQDNPSGTGAKMVIIYGIDINWNPITDTIATNGLTVSSPSTKEFLYAFSAGIIQSGAQTNAGNITIRKASAGATHCQINAGIGSTKKAVFPVFAGCTLYIENFRFEGTKTGTLNGEINLMVYELGEGIRVSHPIVFHGGNAVNVEWEAGLKSYGSKSLVWIETKAISGAALVVAVMSGIVVRHSDSTP